MQRSLPVAFWRQIFFLHKTKKRVNFGARMHKPTPNRPSLSCKDFDDDDEDEPDLKLLAKIHPVHQISSG
jgi:hypothetical protein